MTPKSLQALIDAPPCDINCPPKYCDGDRKLTCGCNTCVEQGGFWKVCELEKRVQDGLLLPGEAVFIRSIISKGALGKNGCKLERRMRSRTCLEWHCKR